MPGFFTHYLCGCKALERNDDASIKNSIIKHLKAYNLGTQGPDIFFYYGFWPWTDSKEMNETGDEIHKHNIKGFFSSALKYITEKGTPEADILTSYLSGYACHYAIDFHSHPYIFYKTGFVCKGENPTLKYTYYHRLFETTLDFILVSDILKCKPHEIKARNLIDLDNTESYAIGGLYKNVLKKEFEMDIETEKVQKAIKDMGVALSVLRDRTGLKKILLTAVESGLGRYPLMSSMIFPLKLTDSLDYLNRQHADWSHPCDIELKNNSSFDEMMESALQKTVQLQKAIYDCITGSISIKDALDIIGNHSFSTGMDCGSDLESKYFDCIFEKVQNNS